MRQTEEWDRPEGGDRHEVWYTLRMGTGKRDGISKMDRIG
jgi:hypothetical protein